MPGKRSRERWRLTMPEDPVVLLRRAAEQIAPPGNAFERTVRRRMRRSGIARITSAAIAAVVFAVALTAVVRAFSQSSRPVGRWPTVPAPQGSAPRGIGVVKMLRAFDAKEAVALTEHALIRTADGGHHWVLATPPGFTRFEASAMSYLDPRHGWIVAVPPAGNGSLSVFRTADGGKTWGRSSIRLGEGLDSLAAGPGQPEAPELGFADRLHGWIRLPVSPAPLLVTSDGGATWRAGPTLDSGDIVQAMTFTSPTNGWAVREHDIALDSMTDLPIQTLYRTRDGGTSWQRVDLPAPPLSFHDAPHGPAVELGLPKFFGSREGVMAASFNSSEAVRLFVYGP